MTAPSHQRSFVGLTGSDCEGTAASVLPKRPLDAQSALGTPPLLPPAVEWASLIATSVAFVVVGRWAWLATERRMRVHGTLSQH